MQGNVPLPAERVLQEAITYAKEFQRHCRGNDFSAIYAADFVAYIDALYPEPDKREKRSHTIWYNRRRELISLFTFAEY